MGKKKKFLGKIVFGLLPKYIEKKKNFLLQYSFYIAGKEA